MVDVAGDIAMAWYSVVSDPNDALSTVIGTLIGAGLARGGWTKAADGRRSIKPEDVGKLGPIGDRLGTIKAARARTCKV